jgi:hypothetical protein
MGVLLTPVIVKEPLAPQDLAGRRLVRFLCEERDFGRERVRAALVRMRQRSLFE